MLQKTGRCLITQNDEVCEIDALLVVTYEHLKTESNHANAPDICVLEYLTECARQSKAKFIICKSFSTLSQLSGLTVTDFA
jgi:hypothetical protein